MPQPVLFRRSAQSSSHCPAFIQSTVKARSACPCLSSEVHHHSLQMYGIISKRGLLSPHGQRLQRKLKVLQGALLNTQTPHNNYLAITFRNSMSCANTALDYEHLTLLLLFAVTGDPRHLSLQWPSTALFSAPICLPILAPEVGKCIEVVQTGAGNSSEMISILLEKSTFYPL